MTFLEWQTDHCTKEKFVQLFGKLLADTKWRDYRKAGSVEAWIRMDEDAHRRIIADIMEIQRGEQ